MLPDLYRPVLYKDNMHVWGWSGVGLLHIVAKHIIFFSFTGIIHMCCGGLECLFCIIAKHILCLCFIGIIYMCCGGLVWSVCLVLLLSTSYFSFLQG